jgi:flagellar motility protein MotE (MotC chaperone)
MSKNGYDQFFKQARIAANENTRSVGAKFEVKKKPKAAKSGNSLTAREIEAHLSKVKFSENRKKKAGVPWRLVVFSVIGIIVALAALSDIERVEKVISKIEIGFMGSARAENATSAPAAAPSGEAAAVAPAKTEESADATKKEWSKEDVDHFSKLNERKRELDLREEELNRLEEELGAQKKELETRMKNLDETRRQISSVLEDRVKVDEQKVDTLVQMYSNMKPSNAAKIFETIDEDLAVEILGKMKKKNAADIMNLLKPEKAQVISEKYAGYKK